MERSPNELYIEVMGIPNPIFNMSKLDRFLELTKESEFQYIIDEYNVNAGGCAIVANFIAEAIDISIGNRGFVYLPMIGGNTVFTLTDYHIRSCNESVQYGLSARHVMLHLGHGYLLDTNGLSIIHCKDLTKLKFASYFQNEFSIEHGSWNELYNRDDNDFIREIIVEDYYG